MTTADPTSRRGFLSRLINRLGVGRKLMLIYLLDLSAVIFISGILVQEKFIAIDFARKELAGNAYIAVAKDALILAAQPAATAPAAAFAERAAAVVDIDTRWGTGLNGQADAQSLAASLRRLGPLAAAPTAPRAQALATARRDAIHRARGLVTLVGNQSNLILDPDLDSYYTMSLVLLRYPELVEIAAEISSLLGAAAAPGQPAPAVDRSQYLILEGRLISAAQDIQSDHAQAFAGAADGRLAAALVAPLRELQAGIDRFRAASQRTLDNRGSADDLAALRARQSELLQRLGANWDIAETQLDRLVHARIDGFFHRMWLHLGTALTLLLAILSAVFFVARQITRPLYRLSDVADRVRASGDYSLRASWDSGDEIGRLVVAFNGMLEQLDRQREVQQELFATARAAQAQQQLIESTPIAMVVTAIPRHEVLHANRQAQAWLGGSRTDPWAEGLEPAVRQRFFQELADRQCVDEFEVCWQGGAAPQWSVLSARRMSYQGQDAVLTAFTPIGHLKTLEQRLELWSKVFEASSEGILIVDGQRRIVTANTAFCRNTGHDLADLVGEDPEAWLSEGGAGGHAAEIWRAAARRGSWRGEVRVRRRDDSIFPAWLVANAVMSAAGELSHYIWTMLDITERKASEERIHFLAHHDSLTRLPNRQLFIERLRLAMQQAQRNGQKVAVLFIDLDRFKTINDSLGHHVGDALLRSVAQRLLQAVRSHDTVCRLGGDEFVVALAGVASGEEVLGILESRIVPSIRDAHVVDGAELYVSCSIGISMVPDDAADIDDAMRHADVAMYQAKALGRDGAHFFTPELNERAHTRLRVELQLRHAIDRGELRLHYQPRIAADTGAMVGVEALLRWRSQELGEMMPAAFIPIAEESRLIVPIGAWVVDQACRQQAQWEREGRGTIGVGINVSALQLRDPTLVQALQQSMRLWGTEPGSLELELTESTLMADATGSLAQLQDLKRLGVKLSIDDFGTGYSSLSYLHRFPIDRLKIDRSFVAGMLDDPTDLAITQAIVKLGHALGLQVVAEGVETDAVAAALRAGGCDELQGYLYARALSADDLGRWMDARTAAARALAAAGRA
jgi:diguanylate cyclase (GGDEF)-like protein/PAS domain S-box-containing protein